MGKSLSDIQKLVSMKRADEAIEAINQKLDSKKFKKSGQDEKAKAELAELYYYLGRAYSANKDHTGAIEKFDQALEYDKTHAAAMTEKGLSHYSSGDNDKAVECCDKVINKINPRFAAAYTTKATILKLAGEDERADENFNYYLKNKDKLEIDSTSELREGFVYSLDDEHNKDYEVTKNAVDLDKNNLQAIWNLICANIDFQNYDEALGNLKKVEKLNSDREGLYDKFAEVYFNLAGQKIEEGNPKEAEKLYGKSLEYCPYQTASYINKGWSLYNRALSSKWASKSSKQEKIEKALNEFQKAEDICQEETLAIAGKIMCYRHLEDDDKKDEALSKLEENLGTGPDEILGQEDSNYEGLMQIKAGFKNPDITKLKYADCNYPTGDAKFWFDQSFALTPELENLPYKLKYMQRAEELKENELKNSDIDLGTIYSQLGKIYYCCSEKYEDNKLSLLNKSLEYTENALACDYNAENLYEKGITLAFGFQEINEVEKSEQIKEGIDYIEKAVNLGASPLRYVVLAKAYKKIEKFEDASWAIQEANNNFTDAWLNDPSYSQRNIEYIRETLEEFKDELPDQEDIVEDNEADFADQDVNLQRQDSSKHETMQMLKNKIAEFENRLYITEQNQEDIDGQINALGENLYGSKDNLAELSNQLDKIKSNDILNQYFNTLNSTLLRAIEDEKAKVSSTIQTSGDISLESVTEHIPVPVIGEIVRTAGFLAQKGINAYEDKKAKNVIETIDPSLAPQIIRTISVKIAAQKDPLDLRASENSGIKQKLLNFWDNMKDKVAGNLFDTPVKKQALEDATKLLALCKNGGLELDEDGGNQELIEAMSESINKTEFSQLKLEEPSELSEHSDGSEPSSYGRGFAYEPAESEILAMGVDGIEDY